LATGAAALVAAVGAVAIGLAAVDGAGLGAVTGVTTTPVHVPFHGLLLISFQRWRARKRRSN
jgi:hypothetical protein